MTIYFICEREFLDTVLSCYFSNATMLISNSYLRTSTFTTTNASYTTAVELENTLIRTTAWYTAAKFRTVLFPAEPTICILRIWRTSTHPPGFQGPSGGMATFSNVQTTNYTASRCSPR
ncbi:hypothetical protein OUZ56_021618 [Daphnia magna]|uniref:Uncharacterized protein n=1 Tax=Daphnia magna TaxID=35525 RepID=A0ABR0AU23_9CRUS|nr:hypothetical protein OUZ56_021618 [Daphnia magna]